MPSVKKIPSTVYFMENINKAIEEAMKVSKTGEKRNAIILNCIVCGLKQLYSIDV